VRRTRISAGLLAAGLILGVSGTAAAVEPTKEPAPIAPQAVDSSVTVAGAGATFSANAVDQWRADFKKSQNVTVSYAAVGSGAGRTQLIAGTVDFAGSDTVASSADATSLKNKYGSYIYVPVTSGGVALPFNVPGLSSLKLTPETIAKIFSGAIKNWNDAAIAADNGTAGPNLPIQVFVRSDSSGTTNVFMQYLSAAAKSSWSAAVSNTFPTNGGQIAKAGSDGVTNSVASTSGGIGYAEVSYANERKLSSVQVKNSAGQFRSPDNASVTAALEDATINPDGTLNLNFVGTNPSSYPISTTTYFIVPNKMDDRKAGNLKAFLTYLLSSTGQSSVSALGYAPLPSKVLSNALVMTATVNPAVASPGTSAPAPAIQTGRVGGGSATPARITTTNRAVAGAGATASPQLAATGVSSGLLALFGLLFVAGGVVLVRRSSAARA
jgi:phosphate transport system substrate-binding protein